MSEQKYQGDENGDHIDAAHIERYGAALCKKYGEALSLLRDALNSGLTASGIADTAAKMRLKIEGTEISEMLHYRTIKRNWAVKRLEERCDTLCKTLVQRGFFPSWILPTVRDTHTLAVRKHTELVDAVLGKTTVSAAQELLAAGLLAEGTIGLTDQSIRFVANQVNAMQRFCESRIHELDDLGSEVIGRFVEQIKNLVSKSRIPLSSSKIPEKDYCVHRVPGYAGYAMIQLGCHQKNLEIAQQGVDLLKVALSVQHEVEEDETPSFHWLNAMRSCGLLRAAFPELCELLANFMRGTFAGASPEYRSVIQSYARRLDLPVLQVWVGSAIATELTANSESSTGKQNKCPGSLEFGSMVAAIFLIIGMLFGILTSSGNGGILMTKNSGTHTLETQRLSLVRDSGTHTIYELSHVNSFSRDSGTHTLSFANHTSSA